MSWAMVGSATNPRTSEVAVIPSWAPESSKERLRRERRIRDADLSPSWALRSMRLRSTLTMENSPATKKALSRMRMKTTESPTRLLMRPPHGLHRRSSPCQEGAADLV
jgi:hypothetical protein